MNARQPTHKPAHAGPTTVSLETTTVVHADALTRHLQQFQHPQPTAVSQFELRHSGQAHAHGWRVDAYFDAPPDIKTLTAALKTASKSDLPEIRQAPTPDLNWVAISQAALKPVQAGRFHIHGSHDRTRVTRGQNTIEIEAGEAFGTAHHATTYLCLEAIDILTRKQSFQRALDLGCGSGVLAIALARAAPKCAIIATDIDKKAIEVTTANARINRIKNRITKIAAENLDHPQLKPRANFDLIVANILAQPLINIAKDVSRIAKPGAALILSGILTDQAREVVAAYRTAGFTLNDHRRRDEWSALNMKKSRYFASAEHNARTINSL